MTNKRATNEDALIFNQNNDGQGAVYRGQVNLYISQDTTLKAKGDCFNSLISTQQILNQIAGIGNMFQEADGWNAQAKNDSVDIYGLRTFQNLYTYQILVPVGFGAGTKPPNIIRTGYPISGPKIGGDALVIYYLTLIGYRLRFETVMSSV